MGWLSRCAIVVAAAVLVQAGWGADAAAQTKPTPAKPAPAKPAPPEAPAITPPATAPPETPESSARAEGEKLKTPEATPVPEGEKAEGTKPTPPQPTPGITPLPGSPSDPSTNEADKRIGVGIDGMFVFPVGNFGDQTGPLVGPVLRFGYRFVPWLETSVRAGYLFAIAKEQGNGSRTTLDLMPIWVELRAFLADTFVGPYAAVAAGMNMYLPLVDPPIAGPAGDKVTELRRRFGASFGLGYVLSSSWPIDVRAQLIMPNLSGKDDALKEKTHLGVSLGVGYTLQF